jgi:uncharacterized membrane protein YdjX (TVP38/TMEM64 family)
VKRYLILAHGLMLLMLLAFGLAVWADIPILVDPGPWLEEGSIAVAVLGIALLAADVFLPIPASLTMIAMGALFGIFWGTVISLSGGLAASWLGFAVGRWSQPLLTKLVPPDEQARANRLLTRHGLWAIVATRPIPILAETVVILAGASPLRWWQLTLGSAAGLLPAALLYALAGATGFTWNRNLLIFLAVMALTAMFWILTNAVRVADPQSTVKKY